MFLSKFKEKGFTLIELLVVISIIAVLSAIVLSSLNSARMRARDTRRMQDLAQIRRALELYYDDNGRYPQSSWISSLDSGWTDSLQVALSPYMSQLPVDPRNVRGGTGHHAYNTGATYVYSYMSSSPAWYNLITKLEDASNQNRCYYKGWINYNGNQAWCAGVHGKTPNQTWSADIYADH